MGARNALGNAALLVGSVVGTLLLLGIIGTLIGPLPKAVPIDPAEVKEADATVALLQQARQTNRFGQYAEVIRLDLRKGQVWMEPAFWDMAPYQTRKGIAYHLAIVRQDRAGGPREIKIRDMYTGKTLGEWTGSGFSAGE